MTGSERDRRGEREGMQWTGKALKLRRRSRLDPVVALLEASDVRVSLTLSI